MTLTGRRALVTGASRGIGREIALRLAREGADVGLIARSTAALAQVASAIKAEGRRSWILPGDLGSTEEVLRLVAQALSTMGSVDVLVNNAGVQQPIGQLTDCTPEAWMSALQINLAAPMLLMHGLLPGMMARRRGSIVNLSGGGALSPRAHFSAYACSKAALVRLTETVAEEVQPFGVRVNAMAPGAINTRMLEEVLAAKERAGAIARTQAAAQAERGGSSLERAADLAVFLAGDRSSPLTGKVISAPHDPWDGWGPTQREAVAASAWYTLRRLDPHTVAALPENVP